ncbi:hypothetical protein PV08_04774 [Exophiala spinifera]|uniref:DUF7053 domain-containing protein n=1 Tax=Exophiala spinifera TaxID=91928 RepID=A0A0D2C1P9_9EURO|nr:uncharacterized protein PV08_04774 [Exophiala spinifera]KIW17579.1 hypothetical protein PV08_04774 [Exophiala spinifera]
MPKRTLFTNITPLPPQVSREVAIAMLHNHDEMIELNPLVIEHHPIKTPRDAPADEFLDCVWQQLTDRVSYVPGLVKGKVSYKACFHDTPYGLQTHIYAPTGLDIREKWSIGGTLPGEPPEARELGVEVPRQGLYLREDCDMRCNRMLSGFVRKNLDNAHKVLVERIMKKAERVEEHVQSNGGPQVTPASPIPHFQPGSHMAKSQLLNTPIDRPLSPQMLSPQQDLGWQGMANHPAFRTDDKRTSNYGPPAYTVPQNGMGYYAQIHHQPPQEPKSFVAELPGSTYHTAHLTPPNDYNLRANNRMSMVSELSSSDVTQKGSPNLRTNSDRMSTISDMTNQYRYSTQYGMSTSQSESSGPSDRFSMLPELASQHQELQSADTRSASSLR